jgi:hypothetical protein
MKKNIKKIIKERPTDQLQPYNIVISQMYLGDGKDEILVKVADVHLLDEKTQKYNDTQFVIKDKTRLDQEINKVLEAVRKIKA